VRRRREVRIAFAKVAPLKTGRHLLRIMRISSTAIFPAAIFPRALVLGAALAGCASAPETRSDEHLIQEPAASAEPGATATAARPATPGEIPRADYDAMLSLPPGRFLAALDPEPRFELSPKGRRFVGWRLRAFFPGDPRFAAGPLQPGDVVVKVNGSSLERPEQFIDAWQAAKGRSDLSLEILRDGRPQALHWRIAAR
jgi:hypothetical protein